jgi:hypothetical protein
LARLRPGYGVIGAEMRTSALPPVEGALGDEAGGDKRAGLARAVAKVIQQGQEPGQACGVPHHPGVPAHGLAEALEVRGGQMSELWRAAARPARAPKTAASRREFEASRFAP